MSYCRWSSNDFSCDVYVYEYVHGGFNVHIAGNRIVGDVPKADHLFRPETIKEYIEATKVRSDFINNAERVSIDLEYSGESFNFDTEMDTADFLKKLKTIGYNVPDYAIEALIDEHETSGQTNTDADKSQDDDG